MIIKTYRCSDSRESKVYGTNILAKIIEVTRLKRKSRSDRRQTSKSNHVKMYKTRQYYIVLILPNRVISYDT